MHSTAGVCAHSYKLYQAFAYIATKPLPTSTTQDSDLQTQSEFILPKSIYFSKLILLLHLEPRSMYTVPWFANDG